MHDSVGLVLSAILMYAINVFAGIFYGHLNEHYIFILIMSLWILIVYSSTKILSRRRRDTDDDANPPPPAMRSIGPAE
jgi:hypothetical protein